MKRLVPAALAVLATTLAMPALAADVDGYAQRTPYYAPPQPYYAVGWGGPYVGVNLGYQWGAVGGSAAAPSGVIGGAQAGFNLQNGPLVYGIEADLQGSGASDSAAAVKFSNPWFGTLRGRAGYAFDSFLVYGTAGLALGELRAESFGWSDSHTSVGWTIGLGGEVGLTPNWTAKVEYLHLDLSSNRFRTGNANDYSSNVLRAGVNYHF
ncbi:MAG: porin family protein [Alphaproteobacteria bacterium]|nr:porin family protein [Alphaproteobacteria bacterium]